MARDILAGRGRGSGWEIDQLGIDPDVVRFLHNEIGRDGREERRQKRWRQYRAIEGDEIDTGSNFVRGDREARIGGSGGRAITGCEESRHCTTREWTNLAGLRVHDFERHFNR